jgi:heme/copper-type cytochrome/quinol oxidase subunit 2
MTLTRTLKIDPSTTFSYYWGTRYGQNLELRFELSRDGVSWDTLESHTDSSGTVTWHQENVTAGELSSYVGDQVQLRFVIDYLGGSVYTSSSIGFYVDEFTINNAAMGGWETLDDQITTTSRMVTVTNNGDYSFRSRANCSQWYNWSDVESIQVQGVLNKVYIPLVLQ